MDFEKDYYAVLGIDKKAKKEDITSAYRKLMLKWHPDKFASKSKSEQEEATRKSAEINEAEAICTIRATNCIDFNKSYYYPS